MPSSLGSLEVLVIPSICEAAVNCLWSEVVTMENDGFSDSQISMTVYTSPLPKCTGINMALTSFIPEAGSWEVASCLEAPLTISQDFLFQVGTAQPSLPHL